ncbi:hypothetical protein BDR07DRAFT_1373683 [Suillus spraguei]|nr:hypothetical protein BDR07DRAFT_1373683 [Suillus spraguei]
MGKGRTSPVWQWLEAQVPEGECLDLTNEKSSPWSKQPPQCLTCLTTPTRTTVSPSPTVVYTRCEDEVNKLAQIFGSNTEAFNMIVTVISPLGFDLEWRVLWNSGAQERRTALVGKMKFSGKAGNKELDPTKRTSLVDPPSLRAGSTKVVASPMPAESNDVRHIEDMWASEASEREYGDLEQVVRDGYHGRYIAAV